MLVHDLHTPLTSILMGLDMLRAGMVSSQQEAGEMLGTVSQAAHSLMEQINNLLDCRPSCAPASLKSTARSAATACAGAPAWVWPSPSW